MAVYGHVIYGLPVNLIPYIYYSLVQLRLKQVSQEDPEIASLLV